MPAQPPTHPNVDPFALAERYRRERDDAVRQRDDLRGQLLSLQREREVVRLATALEFVDAGDAWVHVRNAGLSDQEWESPAQIRRALERVLHDRPHLRRGAEDGRRTRASSGLTLERVRRMSAEEINRRWDEVQDLLAAQA